MVPENHRNRDTSQESGFLPESCGLIGAHIGRLSTKYAANLQALRAVGMFTAQRQNRALGRSHGYWRLANASRVLASGERWGETRLPSRIRPFSTPHRR